jgi:hypothetical protein
MFTWKRLRMINALVGAVAAGTAWWLFYVIGAWSGRVGSPAMFLCFFFTVVGIDRILGASLGVLMLIRRRPTTPRGTQPSR